MFPRAVPPDAEEGDVPESFGVATVTAEEEPNALTQWFTVWKATAIADADGILSAREKTLISEIASFETEREDFLQTVSAFESEMVTRNQEMFTLQRFVENLEMCLAGVPSLAEGGNDEP